MTVQFKSFDVALAAAQTEASATKKKDYIKRGRVEYAVVYFPDGCAGNVKIRLTLDGSLILPNKPQGYPAGEAVRYIALNNTTVIFVIQADNPREDAELAFEGWNEDAADAYSIQCVVAVDDPKPRR